MAISNIVLHRSLCIQKFVSHEKMDYGLLIQTISENPVKIEELLLELNNTSKVIIINESGLHGAKDDCDLFMKVLKKDREQIFHGFTKLKNNYSCKKLHDDWVII